MSRSTFKIMCLATIALIIRTLGVDRIEIGNGLETSCFQRSALSQHVK